MKGNKLTLREFINMSNEKHDNKYNYSLVEYKNNYTKVKIICPEHGIFEQKPSNHLLGTGCSKCSGKNKTNEELILELKNVQGNRYDYSLVNYINRHKKVKIICHIHGIFNQTPAGHLSGKGCHSCNESKGEEVIRKYLIENNIKFENQKRFDKCKNKNSLPFDFYLPEQNLCIEFNGEQHYKSNTYFGGIKTLKYIQKNDNIKIKFCELNKINLLIIKFDENIIEKMNIIY